MQPCSSWRSTVSSVLDHLDRVEGQQTRFHVERSERVSATAVCQNILHSRMLEEGAEKGYTEERARETASMRLKVKNENKNKNKNKKSMCALRVQAH